MELTLGNLQQYPFPALMLVIIVSAIVQDDLTCLVVGAYVSSQELPLVGALVACFIGAFLGDLVWFFSGRAFGLAFLERPPVNWFVPSERLAKARAFFEIHGTTAILITRFLPIIRTPVQVIAGAIATSVTKCILYFAIAALFYVPLLVGGTALFGRAVNVYALYDKYGHLALLAVAAVMWLALVAIRFAINRNAAPLSGPDDL